MKIDYLPRALDELEDAPARNDTYTIVKIVPHPKK